MREIQYYAGAGKAELQLPESLFPTGDGFCGVHDALYVRALLLQGGQSILLLSMDLTSLPTEEIQDLQDLAREALPFGVDYVWISVSHTFSAPHLCPPAFVRTDAQRRANEILRGAIRRAVWSAAGAAATLSPVAIYVSGTVCDVNVNRDRETPEGWWLGADENGCSDKRLTVLQARRKDGSLVGCIAHYAVQSSVMDGSTTAAGDGKLVSGDLAGKAMEIVERDTGAVALFLTGAAGDQAPKHQAVTAAGDIHEAGFDYVADLGGVLGRSVLECLRDRGIPILEKLNFCQRDLVCRGQVLPDRMRLKPTRHYQYEETDNVTTRISVMKAGPLAIVGIQPELSCCIAMQIQRDAAIPYVLIATMVNGGAKYMADERAYERFTYEARNSGFARGSAERLRDCVLKLV